MEKDISSARRPIKSRETPWARSVARKLTQAGVTPNQISILSSVFAALAAGALLARPHLHELVAPTSSVPEILLFVAVILGIQLRLLCNLFDGMVAVEGGKKSKSGELFNDIPDRLSDSVLFVALGYAIVTPDAAPACGWAAALAAALTAYVRTLATSAGAPVSFAGPMAKQHRMAALTLACLASAVTLAIRPEATAIGLVDRILFTALLIILVGSVLTTLRRAWDAYRKLEGQC